MADSSKTTPAQYIQEAEEAFERAREKFVAAYELGQRVGPDPAAHAAQTARDELAIGMLAIQIAQAKMVGRMRA